MASRKDEKEARRKQRLEAEQASAAEGRRKKMFAGIGAAALAAVVVVVALVLISESDSDTGGGEVAQAGVVESQLAGVPQSGTVLGDPKVKVRIIEFGDLQCPACKQFSEIGIPNLIDGPVKDGEAQLEFLNFTIIGPDSVVAAKASLAASEQDRYWQFVELFYRNQGAENGGYVTEEFLTDVARGAGVSDLDAWNAAREDPKWDKALAETEALARELNITGTPSVVVEGPGGIQNLGTFPSPELITDAIAEVG